jgi:hypothetical protein
VCSLPGFYAPRAVIPQRGCATGPRHFFALADNLAITEMLRGSNYFCEMQAQLSILPHCAFPSAIQRVGIEA